MRLLLQKYNSNKTWNASTSSARTGGSRRRDLFRPRRGHAPPPRRRPLHGQAPHPYALPHISPCRSPHCVSPAHSTALHSQALDLAVRTPSNPWIPRNGLPPPLRPLSVFRPWFHVRALSFCDCDAPCSSIVPGSCRLGHDLRHRRNEHVM